VLDTNVAVPGVIGYRLVPPREAVSTACVQAARAGRIQLAFSPELLEEVLDVLQRAPFSLSYRTARGNVGILERGARIVALRDRLDVLKRDPDDNMVLGTAVEARADYLVTWNLADYDDLGRDAKGRLRYRGVEVVTPRYLSRPFASRPRSS
jgi:putative PIN family toxin of toxin-antitoxin system